MDSLAKPAHRSRFDRRTGEDRRLVYSIDYFANGGAERRMDGFDRRHLRRERRRRWTRVGHWHSVWIGSESKTDSLEDLQPAVH